MCKRVLLKMFNFLGNFSKLDLWICETLKKSHNGAIRYFLTPIVHIHWDLKLDHLILPVEYSSRRIFKIVSNEGSVQEIKHGRPKSATAENNIIDILASVEIEPKLSVRQCAQASGTSKNSACRILKTNKIHPYKTRFVQELLDRDPNQLLLGMDKLVGIGPIIGQKQILTTLHMLIPNTLKN
uniref:HTH psq-type domain-containing protein n=1 Tax=Strigamia maritima TaxID=126957 RepID=T1IZU2_STRMM